MIDGAARVARICIAITPINRIAIGGPANERHFSVCCCRPGVGQQAFRHSMIMVGPVGLYMCVAGICAEIEHTLPQRFNPPRIGAIGQIALRRRGGSSGAGACGSWIEFYAVARGVTLAAALTGASVIDAAIDWMVMVLGLPVPGKVPTAWSGKPLAESTRRPVLHVQLQLDVSVPAALKLPV
jgi:hypothetical protein